MPYNIGELGSHGCSGYPVVKTKTGEVMGCHPSQKDAMKQLAALHINEPGMKADSAILPTQPSSTQDSLYPGVGIKRPTQGRAGGTTNSGIKSRYGKKPKINHNGRSGDATGSAGAVSSGGSGGSMGSKSDADIWSGSAFAKQGCTPMTPKCLDIMCKMCQNKNMEIN